MGGWECFGCGAWAERKGEVKCRQAGRRLSGESSAATGTAHSTLQHSTASGSHGLALLLRAGELCTEREGAAPVATLAPTPGRLSAAKPGQNLTPAWQPMG